MTTATHPRSAQKLGPIKILAAARDSHLTPDDLAQRAIDLAQSLLANAREEQTDSERQQAQKIARMMEDPAGKNLTIALSDQVFRSHKPKRIANQLQHLLEGYGVPRYMEWWERAALTLGGYMSDVMPALVVPPFTARLRQETQNVILPGEEDALKKYLKKRRKGGTRLNLNHLGEAILGEEEAAHRMDAYLALLAREDVEYISVKISSVFSQINLVAFDWTVEQIKGRLRTLYRQAMQHQYRDPHGTTAPKFINLDMEEYRDLHLTVAAFQQVLDEPEFQNYRAGIVLQAYLPDSHGVQQELTHWAMHRFERGGAPIKVRIVKGANMAMERVEASIHGWTQAPYRTKLETDANFKRMVEYGMQPEHAQAVHIGVASHNLFDVAYALLLRAHFGVEEDVEFEMLEGMANHQSRAVQQAAEGMLLYAPVVKRDDFHSAVAYLVRRLDENTAEENFLHDLFGLEPGTPQWEKQRNQFLHSFAMRNEVAIGPQRAQDRNGRFDSREKSSDSQRESVSQEQISRAARNDGFTNAADTDWSLPQNVEWIHEKLAAWRDRDAVIIPLQLGGEEISGVDLADGVDPSRPDTTPYRYARANREQVDVALDAAVAAQRDWAAKSVAERRQMLLDVGDEIERQRGDLIGAMTVDAAKSITEADPEVSEAVDFARYYARSLDEFAEGEGEGVLMTSLGVVVVTPPWNFPLAIPAGGVLAALMAGNSVILKPAPEATLVGWQLAQCFWNAGVPREVLQFLPTSDNEVGQALITDERTSAVILTGSGETARLFQSWKPSLKLFAETSGKNSLIVTALADHDQAIKDLVRSAFGHNGQKCSAASLGILEAEVYDNPTFRRQLRDAVQSLPIGSAWEPQNQITPLTQPPSDKLKRALTTLEEGEEWLLEPRQIGDDPRLWSPGIKLGVKQGSFFHQTECFGPVLGLMRAKDLQHAVELANDVRFGLTSGIHSLDSREINYWREHVEAGNGYINRQTTGAVVQRQPFGGWKQSTVGPGAKAGGPDYVLQMATWRQVDLPTAQAELSAPIAKLLAFLLPLVDDAKQNQLRAAAGSYARWWQTYFSQEHDPSQLLGEDNVLRYRPLDKASGGVLVRVGAETEAASLAQVVLAARTVGAVLTVSLGEAADFPWVADVPGVEAVVESEDGLIARLAQAGESPYVRARLIGAVSDDVRRALNEAWVGVVDGLVLANGRLALRHYLREQAISHTTHRYGNILEAA